MNAGGFLYIEPLYNFVYNVLIILYRALGNDLGLALIAIAILSRLIMVPFTVRQLKNVDKNKEFQKKYEEIKEKFSKDKERQTQELAKLQGQYLPGQLSGCFTIILQLLLLIQINHVIRNLFKNGTVGFNEIAYGFVGKFADGAEFDITFLSDLLNLGKSANDIGVGDFGRSWPYLVIAAFLVITQFFSMRIMTALSPKKKKDKTPSKRDKDAKKGKEKGEDDVPSFGEVFQDTNQQMMMFFPLMLGFFSLNYPSGLSLYFATTSLFVIIQQGILKRDKIEQLIKRRFGKKDIDKKNKTESSEDDTLEEKKEKQSQKTKKKSKSKKKKKRKRKSK